MLNPVIVLSLLAASTPSGPTAGAPDASSNPEMTAIFNADQKARQDPAIDWAIVGPQDEARLKRTQTLLDAGALKTGDDFFNAAFVFQHGGSSDHYLKAHLLATIAVAKGKVGATWIAAATLDRYLQNTGKPQILGTQFHTEADGRTSQEPFNRALVSDALRDALGVPPLAAQEEQRKSFERAAQPPLAGVAKSPLRPLTQAPPARLFAARLQPTACEPIPGSEKLLSRPSLRWIVIGEIHGTTETPKTFADLACLASATRPVVVAVEQLTTEQPAIDAFIGSNGDAEATSRFLESKLWTEPIEDGRSSEAYFDLFQRLRALRAAGRITSVVAFQPLYDPGPAGFKAGGYEKALATSLMSRVPPEGRVLVLVGNIHAMRTSPAWAKPAYRPMASYLPANRTVSLDAQWNGGSYWACSSATGCGPQSAPLPAVKVPRGVVMNNRGGPYTGILNLGVAATASLPKEQYAPAQR